MDVIEQTLLQNEFTSLHMQMSNSIFHSCTVFHASPAPLHLSVNSKPIIWSVLSVKVSALLALYGPTVLFANELLCCCHGNRPIATECEAGVAPLTPTHKTRHPGWCIMQCHNPHPSPLPPYPAFFLSVCLFIPSSVSHSLQPPPQIFPSHPSHLV